MLDNKTVIIAYGIEEKRKDKCQYSDILNENGNLHHPLRFDFELSGSPAAYN